MASVDQSSLKATKDIIRVSAELSYDWYIWIYKPLFCMREVCEMMKEIAHF